MWTALVVGLHVPCARITHAAELMEDSLDFTRHQLFHFHFCVVQKTLNRENLLDQTNRSELLTLVWHKTVLV